MVTKALSRERGFPQPYRETAYTRDWGVKKQKTPGSVRTPQRGEEENVENVSRDQGMG